MITQHIRKIPQDISVLNLSENYSTVSDLRAIALRLIKHAVKHSSSSFLLDARDSKLRISIEQLENFLDELIEFGFPLLRFKIGILHKRLSRESYYVTHAAMNSKGLRYIAFDCKNHTYSWLEF